MRSLWTKWTKWTIWTLALVLSGCSTLTITREYGAEHIQREKLSTLGLFMNRAQKNALEKTQLADGSATDRLSTDMTEDAAPANKALSDTLNLAQTMAALYLKGFNTGAASSTTSVSPELLSALLTAMNGTNGTSGTNGTDSDLNRALIEAIVKALSKAATPTPTPTPTCPGGECILVPAVGDK